MSTSSRPFGLAHTLQHLYEGQSLMRIQMNIALAEETIVGRVVDVGGGRSPDYFEYFCKGDQVTVDRIDASLSGIDFEKDVLPYGSGNVDTIVLCNVLEHIYNYRFLMSEIQRVLAPGGRLIGVVPFWVGYHPDPHDYFRYTGEALEKILTEAGLSSIKIRPIGGGPVFANFNTITLSFPRVVRPFLYLWYAPWQWLFTYLRPESFGRQPLGFVFTASVK
ncbi:MAG: hypothetical protein JWN18_484 [Parcubacteria group bacterium]|nr:hypothetical protein [Parcubacteria group bacterium]